MDDSVDIKGSGCALYLHDLDGVDMLALAGWFIVDAFVGLDVLGEVGDHALLGPDCVGLLVDRKVSIEGVLACIVYCLPFLTKRATFLLKPPRISSLLLLMYPVKKGSSFHWMSYSPTTTFWLSAISNTLMWL